MPVEVIIAKKELYTKQIRELFWEYLQWANVKVNEEFRVDFNIEDILDTDMRHLEIFMPPTGRVFVGYAEGNLAGIACLKYLAPKVGEVKRMYVRSEYRQRGLGRMLIDRLVSEAVLIGYDHLRLDSAGFMTDAHRLYRSIGFREIGAYEGSEIPKDYQKHWIFMEIDLGRKKG